MGFIVKAKRVKHENPLEVGLHLVTIKVVRWARNYKGELAVNKDTGEVDIEVVFEDDRGLRVVDLFPNTASMEWALEALRKGAGVYEKGKPTNATDLIGKQLYIYIQGEVVIENNKVKLDNDGKIMYNKQILKKYEQALGFAPAVLGDPARDPQGLPGGIFLKNQIKLQEFLPESEAMSDEF